MDARDTNFWIKITLINETEYMYKALWSAKWLIKKRSLKKFINYLQSFGKSNDYIEQIQIFASTMRLT